MRDVDRLIACEVTKSFASASGATMKALDGVSVELSSGKSVGIIGESGSGKSTLARLLLGLSSASSGQVTFNGREMSEVLMSSRLKADFRRAVQFIGQDTSSSFDPLRTLRDAVRTPLRQLCGLSRADADVRVEEVLGKLSLPIGLADRYPRDVSGGQRQRFAIARAIVVEPRILVCDEVVSALDVSIQGSILNLLKTYCRDTGAGMAFVTHSLPAAGFIADELVVMYAGRIVETGSTRQVIGASQHEFTSRLVESYRARSRPRVAETQA